MQANRLSLPRCKRYGLGNRGALMIPTAIALLFAHACADFLLQPRWMVTHKKHPGVIPDPMAPSCC